MQIDGLELAMMDASGDNFVDHGRKTMRCDALDRPRPGAGGDEYYAAFPANGRV